MNVPAKSDPENPTASPTVFACGSNIFTGNGAPRPANHFIKFMKTYDEITDMGYVVPNESLDYSIIQLYIGKEQYVIPFAENAHVGEALYGMLKLKKEEAEQSMQKK